MNEVSGASHGRVIAVLEDASGRQVTKYENVLTSLYKTHVAGYLASHLIGLTNAPAPPSHIALGTGAFASSGVTGSESVEVISSTKGIGQRLTPAVTKHLDSVFVQLRRTNDPNKSPNAPSGFLTAKLYAFSSNLGSLLVESEQVLAAGIPEVNSWVRFQFASPPNILGGTGYFVVISGLTNGIYNGDSTRNVAVVTRGASGDAYSVTSGTTTGLNKDCAYRFIADPKDFWTSIDGESLRKPIVGAIDTENQARLSAIFTNAEAVGTWGQVGLFSADSGGDLIAARTVEITKEANQSLTLFWEIVAN